MHNASPAAVAALDFLAGGGEMGERMRGFDWAATPFGAPAQWPESLKTSVSICLNSRFPIPLWWGPELRLIYNDAWRPVLGQTKHPGALGARGRDVWPEIWHIIGPMLEGVLAKGEATWSDDGLLMLDRNGYLEEAYFTYSYSPIRDRDGEIKGVFSAVNETTERVIGERQLALLRELGARTAEVRTFEDACLLSAQALATDPQDLPFALIYLWDEERQLFVRAAHCNIGPDHPGAPAQAGTGGPWPLATVLQGGLSIAPLPALGVPWPAGAWQQPPGECVMVPLAPSGAHGKTGVLLAGLSPHRLFDENYRRFIELVGGQVAAAVGNAQAYEEERRRAEALAELDRAKSTFFSNVSHEFRTPLTLMLGPLADLLQEGALPPAARDKLALVERNGLRLAKLVNALLEFSRLEAGRVQARYEETDLCRLTADLASSFRSAMERAGLAFDVRCEAVPPVLVDRDMWERIVLNLLSNALKFTLRGAVRVRLRAEGAHAVLEVADTGVGVPQAELPRLFERFHRVEGTEGRTHEGSGIGLALVQELVKLHGGVVEASSALGAGTTFTVRVPFGRAHLPATRIVAAPAAAPPARQASAYVQEALRWLPNQGGPDPRPESPSGGEAQFIGERYRATLGARVVVADDNADMRQYVAGLLQPYYRVETVGDGMQALEAARRSRPALLISDVMMPRLDGFGLVEQLRRDPQLRGIPVILLSARAGEEARVEGLSAGADDYLVKPFSARELQARVAAMLELERFRRASEEQMRLGIASGQMFTWSADGASGRLVLSENAGEVLGSIPGDLDAAYALLQADDASALRAAVETTLCAGGLLQQEICILRPDTGEPRWLEVRGRRVAGAPGLPPQAAGITFDVTRRRRMEEALREADRRKDEFLAMLAHELRNPLTPIRNAAELMQRLPPGDGRLAQAVQIVQRQAHQLSRMVDDLLDVSRITRGHVALERRPVSLAAVARAAIDAVEDAARRRGHRLELVGGDDPLPVDGDAARLQQCLVNLLANAVKYAGSQGRIQLRLAREEGSAVVKVIDDGPGIEPGLLPSVFDLFVQSKRTLDRAEGGLGIGLSVVRQLVRMHGGEVQARNRVPRGAEFEIRLPLAPAGAEAEEPQARPRAPSRQVLIVDDNADAADTLALMLRLEGHEVQTCYGALAAIEQVAALQPDIVFLDIGLPEMDGYEVARRLRAQPGGQALRLVALTGYGQPSDREQAAAAGFDEHLVKPGRLPELLRVIGG